MCVRLKGTLSVPLGEMRVKVELRGVPVKKKCAFPLAHVVVLPLFAALCSLIFNVMKRRAETLIIGMMSQCNEMLKYKKNIIRCILLYVIL